MTIKVDMHTHTVASAHAYSTVLENMTAAKKAGLEAIGMSDHAGGIEDSPHRWHFYNMRLLPREIEGVFLLRGIELNILRNGETDYPLKYRESIDYTIASLHSQIFLTEDADETSAIYLKIAKDPLVDIIGHCGEYRFGFDHRKVICEFAQTGKIVEMNNHAFRTHEENAKNFRDIAKMCMKYDVPIVVNSDAHFCLSVGKVDEILQMLDEIQFPEELILNTSLSKIEAYFGAKGRRLIKA